MIYLAIVAWYFASLALAYKARDIVRWFRAWISVKFFIRYEMSGCISQGEKEHG